MAEKPATQLYQKGLNCGCMLVILALLSSVIISLALDSTPRSGRDEPTPVVVSVRSANIRQGPSEDATIVGGADLCDRLLVSGSREGWYRIDFGDEDEAWIHGSLVESDLPECQEATTESGGEPEPITLDWYAGGFKAGPNETSPGNEPAFGQLLDSLEARADVAVFSVSWVNIYPSGETHRNRMEYARESGELRDYTTSGNYYRYRSVTDSLLGVMVEEGNAVMSALRFYAGEPSFYRRDGTRVY